MSEMHMHLKLLLPHHILLDRQDVTHIEVETYEGAYGFLPHRLDCVAPLPPGILAFTTEEKSEVFVALDEGVLVKAGADVLVSVRNAMMDADLEKLRDVVEKEFLAMWDLTKEILEEQTEDCQRAVHKLAKLYFN